MFFHWLQQQMRSLIDIIIVNCLSFCLSTFQKLLKLNDFDDFVSLRIKMIFDVDSLDSFLSPVTTKASNIGKKINIKNRIFWKAYQLVRCQLTLWDTRAHTPDRIQFRLGLKHQNYFFKNFKLQKLMQFFRRKPQSLLVWIFLNWES